MGSSIIAPGARMLFQGDSITDAGRDRQDPAGLGEGYVRRVAAILDSLHPELECMVLNRGISGNRVYDLEARWKEDCLDLEPDVLTVLIGINDTWRRYDSGIVSSTDEFEASYRRILGQVGREVKLVLMEPFVLPFPPDRADWREDLDPHIHAVRRIATDLKCLYVPLDGIFAAAATQKEPGFWADDGVHPSPAGHALIARAWLTAAGL